MLRKGAREAKKLGFTQLALGFMRDLGDLMAEIGLLLIFLGIYGAEKILFWGLCMFKLVFYFLLATYPV